MDDFLASGDKRELLELRKELKKRFECDGELLGPGEDEARSASFLGMKIR